MTKPKLSFWQIWNLSFGFLGVQIGYSLQNSNTSSIFESLGADVSHLSYFWLAAPLAGMIVQPIVGLFSDGTWTRWGRRIPYILGGSLISALALVLMPNCPKLLAFAPLAMGAFILLFMDLSFNVTMQPFRALVADMLDDSQKTQGYVVQTFLINLGAVVGAILPLVMTWLGVSDEAAPGHVSPHIAYSYYAGGAILLLTVLVTSFKTREYPPGEFARYNNLSEEDAKPMSFVGLMRNVPGVMVRLGVTQFFSWAALFLMWTYLKPAITGVVTDHATGEVLSAGATQTWVGVLNGTYPIPACIAALFLGRVAARYGNKPVYAACLLAGALGFACKEGVYAIFPGPCYETAAEIRAYEHLGADAIGMSTVPEVIAANYLGMAVLGIACITNMATGIAREKHSHQEVLRIANESSQKLCALVERVVREL